VMHGVPRGPTRSVHRGDHGPSIELRNGSNSEVPISFSIPPIERIDYSALGT
jgi:hypothetical protein